MLSIKEKIINLIKFYLAEGRIFHNTHSGSDFLSCCPTIEASVHYLGKFPNHFKSPPRWRSVLLSKNFEAAKLKTVFNDGSFVETDLTDTDFENLLWADALNYFHLLMTERAKSGTKEKIKIIQEQMITAFIEEEYIKMGLV